MRSKLKGLGLLLLLAVFVVCIAACSEKEATPSTDDASPSTQPTGT